MAAYNGCSTGAKSSEEYSDTVCLSTALVRLEKRFSSLYQFKDYTPSKKTSDIAEAEQSSAQPFNTTWPSTCSYRRDKALG